MLLAMAVVAHPMVSILLSPKFLPVVPVFRILALGVAFRAGTKVLVHYFNATNRPGVFSLATVVGMLSNLLLLLVLLPKFGLPGAGWAMTLAYLLNGSVLVVAFRRYSGLGFLESWLPRRSDLDMARDSYTKIRERLAKS
jgi:O-antigen/teichoic acid export membrane protein